MALPSTYVAPKDNVELQKRKDLDAKIKLFATTNHGTSLATPQETAKELAAEGAGIGLSENQVRNKFNLYSGVEDKPAPIGTQPVTRLLDRYDKMQNSPTGATSLLSAPPRSLESESGKAFRMARKLGRMGLTQAANQFGAMGAAAKVSGEPSIKSQSFIELREQSKQAAVTEAAADADFKKKQRDTLNRILDQQNKDLDLGKFDSTKYPNSPNA